MVITLDGPHTVVEVNGVKVTDYTEGQPVPDRKFDFEPQTPEQLQAATNQLYGGWQSQVAQPIQGLLDPYLKQGPATAQGVASKKSSMFAKSLSAVNLATGGITADTIVWAVIRDRAPIVGKRRKIFALQFLVPGVKLQLGDPLPQPLSALLPRFLRISCSLSIAPDSSTRRHFIGINSAELGGATWSTHSALRIGLSDSAFALSPCWAWRFQRLVKREMPMMVSIRTPSTTSTPRSTPSQFKAMARRSSREILGRWAGSRARW
jgi:hypothetical protein